MLYVIIFALLTNRSVTGLSVRDIISLLDVMQHFVAFRVRFHLACFGLLLPFAKIILNFVLILQSENTNNLF